jgi:glycerol-3-phosphate acyltransferase PlsY
VGALVVIALAYLAGSIPTGVLLGRLAGVDVQSAGSGNIGATNVARTAGRTLGVLTLVGDALKGLLPVLVAHALGFDAAVVAMTAVAALCGHVFSIFLSFHGGKGVATGAGVMLGLAPAIVPIPLAVFAITMALSKIVSLSSILAAVSGAIAVVLFGYPSATDFAAAVIAGLIIFRHRENISRLAAGTEQPFESKKR